jgi:predicted ribosome quality control (RQC) complex YloA/Tae2 family protein
METLTSVALARELNGALKKMYIAGAEQAEGGRSLLIFLRERISNGSTFQIAAAERRIWLVLSSCGGESTLFCARKKPEELRPAGPTPFARRLEGRRIERASHNAPDRAIALALNSPAPVADRDRDHQPRRARGTGERSEREAQGDHTNPADSYQDGSDPGRDENRAILLLELMAGRPRAVLIEPETNVILDVFPTRGGGHRLAPGECYRPPERPGNRSDPWKLDAAALDEILGPEPSEGALKERLLGVGKVLAGEVLSRRRSTGKTAGATLKGLLDEVETSKTGGYIIVFDPEPGAAPPPPAEDGGAIPPAKPEETGRTERAGGGTTGPMFAGRRASPEHPKRGSGDHAPSNRGRETVGTGLPLALGFKPSIPFSAEVTSSPTVNEALFKAFLLCRETKLREDLLRRTAKEIRAEIKRTARTRRNLEEELEEARGAKDIRRKGELILAHMSGITKGQTSITARTSEGAGREELRIGLQPHLAPAANAAAYFKRAKKLEKKLAFLPERIERLAAQESRLREKLERTLSGGPPPRGSKRSGPAQRREGKTSRWPTGISPRRFLSSDGWTMYVGRNNKENDYITFVLARPDDFWFHAQGTAGSHVILRREGRKSRPSKRCLEETASVAAHFSKARTSQTVPVVYTEKRYVRKPRKAKAGAALYSNEKTLLVNPGLP